MAKPLSTSPERGIYNARSATSAKMQATPVDDTWLVDFDIVWRDPKTGAERTSIRVGVRLPR